MQELCKVLYPLENTTKLNKDMMLALLLEGTGQNLTLGSVQMCRRAQLRILGIGKGRSSRLKKGHPDDRFGARPKGDPRGPTSLYGIWPTVQPSLASVQQPGRAYARSGHIGG